MTTHILLIEDDTVLRSVLSRHLEKAGYKVTVAEHGRAGTELLAKISVDLVITDLLMPEQDGIETIIKLRQRLPNLPVLAISGGGKLDPDYYLRVAKKLGATNLLRKPFMREELLESINTLLAPQTSQKISA